MILWDFRDLKCDNGVFQGVSRGTKRSQERFKGVPGGFRGYYEVSGAFKRLTGLSQRHISDSHGPFRKLQGVLGDLRGFSRKSQGVSEGVKSSQGHFKGITWGFKGYYGGLRVIVEAFQRVPTEGEIPMRSLGTP